MKDTILQILSEIEESRSIKILFACESGSRSWGFESPDSDWDIRFIYVSGTNEYLSIEEKRDVIEYADKELALDFVGWDLKKALRLGAKSNPQLYEWLTCPVYINERDFRSKIRSKTLLYYSKEKCIRHYLGMAKNNYREYFKGDMVKLKKYLYVLRPLIAIRWIVRHNEPPPVDFPFMMSSLMDSMNLPSHTYNTIQELIVRKRNADELGIAPKIPVLDQFIENEFINVDTVLREIGQIQTFEYLQPLNSFLIETIREWS